MPPASSLQRARFGVLPQIMPVLASQVLYNFESNTRSATVIGAIVGGGIELLLTQAIQTQKDWEDVAYYLILIVLRVMALDSLSGLIRRKLIKGQCWRLLRPHGRHCQHHARQVRQHCRDGPHRPDRSSDGQCVLAPFPVSLGVLLG